MFSGGIEIERWLEELTYDFNEGEPVFIGTINN